VRPLAAGLRNRHPPKRPATRADGFVGEHIEDSILGFVPEEDVESKRLEGVGSGGRCKIVWRPLVTAWSG